ncbi:MAG: zf-HC2 domain-containing protein [Candidatus Binatia bacterium]
MRCEEMPELISALVDHELSSEDLAAAQSHMAECGNCRALYEQERALKQQVRSTAVRVTAPAALRQKVQRLFNEQAPGKAAERKRTWQSWFALRALRPAFAVMLIVLALSPLVYRWWPVENVSLAALATHEEIIAGQKVPARVSDPEELRKQLAQAVDGRFAPIALDLSKMKLVPVTGFMQKIDGREVLMTIYQGDGRTVTCFTFLGDEADAPQAAEIFYDPAMRMNFYLFSRGDVNGVLHKEGRVICLLASKMAAAELLALVRGKPGHA